VLVDAQIAVGLDNADPTADLTDTVTLTRLALVAGDTSVELADAAFHDATVKGRDTADMEYVYDATATNGAVAALCGAAGVVLRAEVRGATFGSATGDIPATLTCAQDRRAGELATRALGPNPAHRPCEIDRDDGTVTRLGYDADGRLEVADATFENATTRTVFARDAAGRVTDAYGIADGLFQGHTRYTYEGERPTSSFNDDYQGDTATLSWSWSSDRALAVGDHAYTLSADGLTVTDTQGDGVKTTTYGAPISLATHLTQGAVENAAQFQEQEERVVAQGQEVGELAVTYSDGDIATEVATAHGLTGSTATWKYACSF
jgi:YD repeat-containing protein